jgi:hypothetical protein
MSDSGQPRREWLVRAGRSDRENATEKIFGQVGAEKLVRRELNEGRAVIHRRMSKLSRGGAAAQRNLLECGFRDEVSEIEVTDSVQAQALAFIGSPSIRIGGNDIEPTPSSGRHYGLSCRTYLTGRKLSGGDGFMILVH